MGREAQQGRKAAYEARREDGNRAWRLRYQVVIARRSFPDPGRHLTSGWETARPFSLQKDRDSLLHFHCIL